jgi:hypothetical protein
MDRILITTNGTYPWSFVTHIYSELIQIDRFIAKYVICKGTNCMSVQRYALEYGCIFKCVSNLEKENSSQVHISGD